MSSIIEFKDVTFQYEENGPKVLKNISFSIRANETTAIIGHNGSGKSTIAKLMNGLLVPQEGEIYIDGIQLTDDTVWDIRQKIGMVFQNPDNQFVGTTVRDDVAFGMENRGFPRQLMVERIEEALQSVQMESYAGHEPHRLSGGQKQRVAIAGIFALQPKVMILDEATVMLDPIGRKEIMETITKLRKEENLTLITVTHDLEEVIQADYVIVLNEGKIYQEGTPEEILKEGEALRSIGLDYPFSVQLAKALRQKGLPIEDDTITQEQLLEALWTLHSKT